MSLTSLVLSSSVTIFLKALAIKCEINLEARLHIHSKNVWEDESNKEGICEG